MPALVVWYDTYGKKSSALGKLEYKNPQKYRICFILLIMVSFLEMITVKCLGLETKDNRGWVDSVPDFIGVVAAAVGMQNIDAEFAMVRSATKNPLTLGKCGTRCTWSTIKMSEAVQNPTSGSTPLRTEAKSRSCDSEPTSSARAPLGEHTQAV